MLQNHSIDVYVYALSVIYSISSSVSELTPEYKNTRHSFLHYWAKLAHQHCNLEKQGSNYY